MVIEHNILSRTFLSCNLVNFIFLKILELIYDYSKIKNLENFFDLGDCRVM